MADTVEELFGKMQQLTKYEAAPLSPEDIAAQQAAQQQMDAARKYLNRDLISEADTYGESKKPKNKLLQILQGFGEGALYAQQPKYKDARDRKLDELTTQYQRQAPVMQRDLANYDTVQGRIGTEKERLKQRAVEQENKFKSTVNQALGRYDIALLQDPKVKQAVLESIARTKGLEADAVTKDLDNAILKATGAHAGTATKEVVNATVGLKQPDVKNAMGEAARAASRDKALLEIIKAKAKGSGSGGGGSTTISSIAGRDPEGNPEKRTNVRQNIKGGGSPGDFAGALNLVNQEFGPGAVQPTLPVGGQVSTPKALGQLLQGGKTPFAGTPINQAAPRATPPPQASASPFDQVGITPLPGPAVKKVTPAEEASAKTLEKVKLHADSILLNLSDKSLKAGLNSRMGDTLGDNTVAWLYRKKRGSFGGLLDTNESRAADDAMKDIVQHGIGDMWEGVADMSGKTVTPGELKMAMSSTLRLNSEKTGVLDNPDDVVKSIIGQRVFIAVQELKNEVYKNTKGNAADKAAAMARIGDLSEPMREYQRYLLSQYRQDKPLTGKDFEVKKILPHLLGSKAEQMIHEFTK